jgi:hypothetical protein
LFSKRSFGKQKKIAKFTETTRAMQLRQTPNLNIYSLFYNMLLSTTDSAWIDPDLAVADSGSGSPAMSID